MMSCSRSWYCLSELAASLTCAMLIFFAMSLMALILATCVWVLASSESAISSAVESSLIRANSVAVGVGIASCDGYRERASGPLCHFPGQWVIANLQPSVDSFRFWRRGLAIVSMSLLFNMPRSGLWSNAISRLLHPRVNMRECLRDHETARASPSVGEYLVSLGVRNLDPA